jgi:hypothetical protein
MSATGARFDPRYDPRYQRGWVDGAADGAASAESAPVDPPAPTAPPASAPAARVPAAPRAEAPLRAASAEMAPSAPAAAAPASDPAVHVADDDPGARVMRIASGIAWAITFGAIFLGAGLVWSLAVRAPAFAGPSEPTDLLIQGLAQYAAPSLLATGVLGVVVLTVVDGLRRARTAAPRRADGDGNGNRGGA